MNSFESSKRRKDNAEASYVQRTQHFRLPTILSHRALLLAAVIFRHVIKLLRVYRVAYYASVNRFYPRQILRNVANAGKFERENERRRNGAGSTNAYRADKRERDWP